MVDPLVPDQSGLADWEEAGALALHFGNQEVVAAARFCLEKPLRLRFPAVLRMEEAKAAGRFAVVVEEQLPWWRIAKLMKNLTEKLFLLNAIFVEARCNSAARCNLHRTVRRSLPLPTEPE